MRLSINKRRFKPEKTARFPVKDTISDRTINVSYIRLDAVCGISQDEANHPLEYIINMTSDFGVVGAGGASGQRRSYVVIPTFKLPKLLYNHVIKSVNFCYTVDQYRAHNGIYFTADSYLVKLEDPTTTDLELFYHGTEAEETNEDVIYIDSYDFGVETTDTVDFNPPINITHQLVGDSLDWFRNNLYDNNIPTQDNVYFRLNKSVPDVENLGGAALNRFGFVESLDCTRLTITTMHKGN